MSVMRLVNCNLVGGGEASGPVARAFDGRRVILLQFTDRRGEPTEIYGLLLVDALELRDSLTRALNAECLKEVP